MLQPINLDFDKNDLYVTLSYTDSTIPKSIEKAERICSDYIRQVKHAREELGLPPLKYIKVTSCKEGKDETPTRIYHHIVMSGGLDRDFLEEKWGLGFANVNRLQTPEGSLEGLYKHLMFICRRSKGLISAEGISFK
ncbi:MAG: hypothetical protein LBR72_05235 [Oscillospiraceae bacterium]|jgi:hypothetical protein|nr:hypothetical protein [Oscillospiraceae bacterium]